MDNIELLQAIRQIVRDELKPLEERTQRLEVLLENNIPHEIHVIAEQHTSIIKKLDALSFENKKNEDTRGTVSVLETVVKNHSNEIRELQQKAM